MNTVKNVFGKVNVAIDTGLKASIGRNSVISGTLYLIILVYISLLTPEMPPSILAIFRNQYFKVLVFSIILWTAHIDPVVAILIAIAFLMTANIANNKSIWEFMENTMYGDFKTMNMEHLENAMEATQEMAPKPTEPKQEEKELKAPGCYAYSTYDVSKVVPFEAEA
jgi:hypothetical protein